MEISVEELNELLSEEFKRGRNSIEKESKQSNLPFDLMDIIHTTHIPTACKDCPNHPSNGGSGICNCVLPDEIIY